MLISQVEFERYAQLMAEEIPYLTVTLDLKGAIELAHFVDFFAALGDQFRKSIKSELPDFEGEPKIFVKEVRSGSIVADLFPGGVGDLIDVMDKALIVTTFAAYTAKAIKAYISGQRFAGANKSDLKDYLDTVKAVAGDSDGRATIATTVYREGLLTREVVFSFTSPEARQAVQQIESHKQELDRVSSADHSRVLMVFTRSDVGAADIGKRSGERVVVEEISGVSRPLVYASNLAEERIKFEIRNADDNIYHKGFVVDVNVQTRNGSPVAYAVTHVHQVIDLPN